MKIILLQDEKKLGKKGDIIEASEGYARNYILPKKIGVEATSKNMNDLKLHKANEEKVAQENLDAAKALLQNWRLSRSWLRSRQEKAAEPSVPYPPRRSHLPARSSMALKSIRKRFSFPRA